jgi:alpha-beta hydrolase superfamily lysophospholipase
MRGVDFLGELDNPINWKTLAVYARAVHEFTKSVPAKLTRANFARLFSVSYDDLPEMQTLSMADGYPLSFRFYPARTSGRVLILIHGSSGFGDQMHAMARQLSEHDIACVYTLTMRGHGPSEARRGHAVNHPGQMVADVARFLDHVRAETPDANITLGGHSAGGGLVVALSRTAADRQVSSYLFLAPFLGLGSPVNRPHFGGWVSLRTGVLRALTIANLFGIKRFNNATVVDFNMSACGDDPRYVGSWSFHTMLAFGPGRWIADAPPIAAHKPVLVLAGHGDECFDRSLYPQAFKVVAPQAKIPDVGSIGHWDLLVDDTAIAEIGDWLAGQALADLADMLPAASAQSRQQQMKKAS